MGGGASAQRANPAATRLIIIGPGGTGKSTLFKQVKLHHTKGFSQDELLVGRSVVRTLLLDTLRVLARNTTIQSALGGTETLESIEESALCVCVCVCVCVLGTGRRWRARLLLSTAQHYKHGGGGLACLR